MYVSLYPHRQVRRTRLFVLRLGIFLVCGGAYALLNEVLLREQSRFYWALAAGAILIAGLACLCVGLEKVRMKDAFFSMNPDQIKFRISVFGKEHSLLWSEVASVHIDRHSVTFSLKSGKRLLMRTGAIQSAEVAYQVQTSIRLAAMEKRITINGVPMGQFTTSSSS